MKVTTNHVPRELVDAYELTAEERAEFDYLDWSAIDKGEDSASFFRFRGDLYDLGEFERLDTQVYFGDHERKINVRWDGIQTDSYFSATVVRYVNDNEQIVVGRVYS